jgi:hypothetical protein
MCKQGGYRVVVSCKLSFGEQGVYLAVAEAMQDHGVDAAA